jgi:microcystin-dependent protein
MADVAADLKTWSATASSNTPANATAVGTGLAPNLREIQKVVRQDLATKGSDIASATTTDIGAVAGLMHDITGTTTITGLGTVSAGIWKVLKFEGALTLTHNATSLILPGGTSILTVDGDIGIFISEGSGNWRCISYTSAGRDQPSGIVCPYAGTAAPSGWLLCYGQAVSRTTYAGLFATLSTTYGVGDGATTFNIPDLRGRVVAGQDDMGGSSANRLTDQTGGLDGDTLGDTGGSETHTLTEAQLAAHNHEIRVINATGGAAALGTVLTSAIEAAHSAADTIADAGSGSAHNNVQPTIILNYIIKT